MAEQQDRILGYFLEEANQHLQTIEQGLLKLQETVKNPAAVKELFRAAHSIKGSAAMLGLFAVQQSSRELETVFNVLKEQPLKVDNQLQALCFQCYGLLQSAIGELDGSIDAGNSDTDRHESAYGETFDRLKKHLAQLQAEAETVPTNELEITPEVGLTIEQVFGEYVNRKLGEINQLCQQADSPETRSEIQAICRKLGSLGDDFEFLEWTHLLTACRLAAANISVPIDRLNGAVQLSIKRAQHSILEHRPHEVEVTPELQTLIVADSHSSSLSIDAPVSTAVDPSAIIYEPIESSLDLDDNAIAFIDGVSFDEELSGALSDSLDLFDNHALLADGAIGTDSPSQLDLAPDAEDTPNAFLAAPVDFFASDSNPRDLPASDAMWATNASPDNDVNLWSDDVFNASDIDATPAAFAFSDVDLPQPHDFDLQAEHLPASEFSPEFSIDIAEDEVLGYANDGGMDIAALNGADSLEFADSKSNDLELEPLANLPALETLDTIEQSAIDTIDQLALDTASIGTIDTQDLIGDNDPNLVEIAALDLPTVDSAHLDLPDSSHEAEEDPAWSDDLMGMHDRQSLVGEDKLVAIDDIGSFDFASDDSQFETVGTIDLEDPFDFALGEDSAEFAAVSSIDFGDSFDEDILPTAGDFDASNSDLDLNNSDIDLAAANGSLFDDDLVLPTAGDFDFGNDSSLDLSAGDEFESIGTIDLMDDLSVGLDLPAGDEFESIGTIDLMSDLSTGLDLPLDLEQAPNADANNYSDELHAAATALQIADLPAAVSADESVEMYDEGTFFQDYDEDLDISGNLLSGILGKEPTPSVNTISDEPSGMFATSLGDTAPDIELPDFEMSYDIDVESTGFALDEMRSSDLSNSLENEASSENDLDSLDLNSIDLPATNGLDNLDLNSIDLPATNGLDNLDLNSIDLPATSGLDNLDLNSIDLLGDNTLDRLDLDNLDPVAATDGSFEHLDGLLAGAGILGGVGAIAMSQMDDLDNLLGAPAATDNLNDLDNLLGSTPAPAAAKPEKAAKTSDRKSKQRTFEETMRVSVKNLNNLNNLVGELVVNRNTLEQDQNRMRQFIEKLLSEVQKLNEVGKRMQDLYERSLMENSLQAGKQQRSGELSNNLLLQQLNAANGDDGNQIEYDPLEMDRFTPIHLLSQKMIELTVRIRESTADIEFVVDGSTEVTRTLRQITNQVQEDLTKTRMNPFSQTADRLQRGVRDNGLKYGKQVNLDVDGRDTQIDKVILENLTDPLIHMVNNSIAHGIETPEERMAKGKPAEGKITIRALHQGNQTIISVADDGAGIDTERVKAKALEKGIITTRQAGSMTKQEIYELLFLPSFSTKDQADELAGRGVGMDVVMKSLQDIRGTITTESQLGVGTTFTIRLPLALSITKALIAVNNKTSIAFPMDGIEDTQDMHSDQIQLNNEGEPCIFWRDRLMPFKRLSELLGYNRPLARSNFYGSMEDDEDITSILIVRSDSNFIAVSVDKILSEQEIVIKPLQGPANKPLGIAGATVMGDGRIVPIADAIELVDLARGTLKLNKPQVAGFIANEPAVDRHEPMVLIVDDSITVRELLSLTFKRAGYRVEQARDGQEAWDKLRAGLPCDIVFCDIEMPRMDGLELLSRIQKDMALSKVPVAMLTSRGSDRHRQIASQLGASGYFIKPYLEEALLDAAKRMIKGEVLAIV